MIQVTCKKDAEVFTAETAEELAELAVAHDRDAHGITHTDEEVAEILAEGRRYAEGPPA